MSKIYNDPNIEIREQQNLCKHYRWRHWRHMEIQEAQTCGDGLLTNQLWPIPLGVRDVPWSIYGTCHEQAQSQFINVK